MILAQKLCLPAGGLQRREAAPRVSCTDGSAPFRRPILVLVPSVQVGPAAGPRRSRHQTRVNKALSITCLLLHGGLTDQIDLGLGSSSSEG